MTRDRRFGEGGLVDLVDLSRFHRVSKCLRNRTPDWERNVNSLQSRNKPDKIRPYYTSKLPDIRWRGNQGIARCPQHSDRRPSLSVNAEQGLFYCHACKISGNLHEFERLISSCDLKTAKKRIGKLAKPRRRFQTTQSDRHGLFLQRRKWKIALPAGPF